MIVRTIWKICKSEKRFVSGRVMNIFWPLSKWSNQYFLWRRFPDVGDRNQLIMYCHLTGNVGEYLQMRVFKSHKSKIHNGISAMKKTNWLKDLPSSEQYLFSCFNNLSTVKKNFSRNKKSWLSIYIIFLW